MSDPMKNLCTIWKTLFGVEPELSLTDFQEDFCADLPLPMFAENLWGGEPVAISKPYRRVVAQNQIAKNVEEMQKTPNGQVNSPDELLSEIFSKLIFSGDNCYDSINVVNSDNVFKSLNVYQSRSVHESKNVIFCTNCVGLENAAACDDSGFSQFVIRAMDSINCSRCLDVYQSGKCSNSIFLSNCYDVHECILCTNLRSKRFCIGNMQFSESAYNELRKQILAKLVFCNFKPMYKY